MVEFEISESLKDLHAARKIREKVFIEEQGFEVEFDNIDEFATHILITVNGEPAATGRVFPHEDDTYIIGRIAVLPEYRGRDLGRILVRKLEEIAKTKNARVTVLSAQVRVKEFYKKIGYTEEGETYLDEGCAHIKMRKELQDI